MKKEGYWRKTTFEKKNTGSRVGHRLTGLCRVVTPAGLLTNSDRSSHWIDPPGRSDLITVHKILKK
jgi:hypothetical protein